MKTIEDEVIGELRYLTVEFRQAELVTGGMGVISQDAVKRYFIEKRPDLKVKKCGGLKLDSQRNIVTMRFGVVKERVSVTAIILDEFADKDNDYSAAQKLLNPGYDEIKAKCVTFQREYDAIVVLYDKLEARYSKLIEKYDALVEATGLNAHAAAAEDSADLAEAEEVLAKNDSVEMTGADGSKIEGEKAEDGVRGDRSNVMGGGAQLPDRFEKEESDSNTE